MTGLDQYIAYLNNQLSKEERHTLEQKLVTSEQTRRDLERARGIVASGGMPVVEPRSSVLNSVKAAFRRQQQRLKDAVTNSAEVEFDSWQNPALGGVRGQIADRQMLFSSGDLDLDIQFAKDADAQTQTMHGQLLSTTDEVMSGIELNLSLEDGYSRRVLTDEFGRFRFSYLATGHYDLQVRLEERNIRVDIKA
ncbi:MAG: carboxypeptidase-like regulatory domain-containing protein [Candidatus Promineifilaceae bacterium]